MEFFGELLDKAWGWWLKRSGDEKQHTTVDATTVIPWKNKVFCDIGSGAGRLVITAAALHPNWKVCKGLEILEGIHDFSVEIAERCRVKDDHGEENKDTTIDTKGGEIQYVLRVPNDIDSLQNATTHPRSSNTNKNGTTLSLAPIQFTCGSFTDPYQYLGDIDCAFVFSSCMKPNLLQQLSVAIGRQCRPGTIIITTEFPLFLRGTIDPLEDDIALPFGDYEIELLEKIDGWCWLMGGESTAYIHRVKRSLWGEYDEPREKPRLSLEEEAWRLVQLMEKGELTDTKEFLRNVYNSIVFHGYDDLLRDETEEGEDDA